MFKNKTNLLLGIIIILLMVIVYLLFDNRSESSKGTKKTSNSPPTNSALYETAIDHHEKEQSKNLQNGRPSAMDPNELTDQEIRNIREKVKRETGGEYYYYTPGRHVEPSDQKSEDKNWADRNVKK